MINKLTILILFSLLASNILAAEQHTSIKDTESRDSISNNSNGELTSREKDLAKQWSLTESDWRKYKLLMEGPRGNWSPGLDPITALGVSATSITERKRYAEILVKVQSQRFGLEIAFEIERMSAAERLHAGTKMVNNDEWIAEWRKQHNGVKTKISFFVDAKCIDDCKKTFMSVQDSVGKNSVLDIYFAPGANSDTASTWAQEMKISPDVVKTRKITLNFDNGSTSEQMNVNLSKLPQVRVLDVASGKMTETFNK